MRRRLRGGVVLRGAGLAVALVAIGALTPTSATAKPRVLSGGGFDYVVNKIRPADPLFRAYRARCPGGTHVYGGGYYNNKGFAQVVTRHAYPFDGSDRGKTPDDGWAAVIGTVVDDTIRLRIFAICARPAPAYVRLTDLVPATARTNAELPCPASHPNVVSGGSRGSTEAGQTSSFPDDAAVAGEPDSWQLSIDNPGPDQRSMKYAAVCAKRNVTYASAGDQAAGQDQELAAAACPDDRMIVGGGASHQAPVGKIVIAASDPTGYPEPGGDWEAWIDNYDIVPHDFTAYASCMKPLG